MLQFDETVVREKIHNIKRQIKKTGRIKHNPISSGICCLVRQTNFLNSGEFESKHVPTNPEIKENVPSCAIYH